MDVTMTTKDLLGDGGNERTYSLSGGATLGGRCRVRWGDLLRSPEIPAAPAEDRTSLWTQSHVWQHMPRVACFLHPLFLEREVAHRLCNAPAHIQPSLSPHPLRCQYCQCFQYGREAAAGFIHSAGMCFRATAEVQICRRR